MLEFLRRGVKTWVAKALLGLLIISFAVWGIGGEIFSFSFSTPIASVGNTKVTAEEFARAMEREQNRLSQSAGERVTYDTMRQLGIDQRVVAGLLRDAAFQEELADMDVRVPDQAALEAIASQPEFQSPDGTLSRPTVQRYMAQLGLTEEQFVELNRKLVGQNLLIGPAIAPTRSPPGMPARLATYQGEMRQVKTAVMPLSMATDPGMPTEEQVQEFYDANPALYTEPVRRWGKFLFVDFNNLIKTSLPSPEEVRETYDADISVYTTEPTREIDQLSMNDMLTAEAAISRVESGEITFEELLAEMGEDSASVDLGWVKREDVAGATANAIFAVTEPGALVPVKLPVGAAIIRVRDLTEGGAIAFDEVREEIETRLASEAAYEKAPQIANQIEEMRAGGSSLTEIAEATGLTLGAFDGLAADGTLPGGPAEGVMATPAFIQETFEALDGEERPIIETEDGSFLLVYVDREDEGGLQSLDTVRDKVLADWQNAQRLAEIETRAEKLRASIDGGATLDAAGSALGLEVTEQIPFTRETGPTLLPSAIVDAAFAAETGAGLAAPLTDGSGVMVAQVTSSIQLPPELAQESTTQLDQLIEQTIRADAGEYLARAITAKHETTTNATALEEVFTHLTGRGSGVY
ncbi:SurA N-terminal domain-containing protein [Rhodobacteraceae bacterium NNCM2]|nr:SurA N-terminal domain-containing protein [Coraliihabitans acroporae]